MLLELSIYEEFYRPGCWKIYYRLDTTPLRKVSLSYDGSAGWSNIPLDAIKFSGHDAKERAHKVFEEMKKECLPSAIIRTKVDDVASERMVRSGTQSTQGNKCSG